MDGTIEQCHLRNQPMSLPLDQVQRNFPVYEFLSGRKKKADPPAPAPAIGAFGFPLTDHITLLALAQPLSIGATLTSTTPRCGWNIIADSLLSRCN